ncbi:MAG TPA: hypothetical protein VMB70_00825, partial [Terriglobia bacterium]|nr:hypothetical protein [Terriglobia bacterium]
GQSTLETSDDLFVVALEDPSKPIPVATTPALERNAQFSPGAKWIAYESEDATGRVQVFVQPFPGDVRARRQVSTGGGSLPQWGPGGKELFFLTPDNRLAAVGTTISPDGLDIEIGAVTVLFTSSVPNNSTYVPAPDGQRFVFNEAPAVLPPPIFVLSNAAGGKR